MAWCDFITHSLGQFCASWFDQGQAQLGPDRDGGLYLPLSSSPEIHDNTLAATLEVSPQGPIPTLAAALDQAAAGDTIVLRGGTHPGPPDTFDLEIILVATQGGDQ